MIVLIFASVLFTFLLPAPLASTPSSSQNSDLSQQTRDLGRTEPMPTRLDVALRAWFQKERDRHGSDPCPGFCLATTTLSSLDHTRLLRSIAASDCSTSLVSLVYTLCAILR
jgi:hypothetical protein